MARTDSRRRVRPNLPGRVGPKWPLVQATAMGLSVALAIFVLYFLAYPVRHLTLPVGFDPPWYVWRAEHLTSLGVGTGQLAARPGYPVLSAILGSLTGLSQLEMTVVLSLTLVGVLSLAVGAFAREGLGFDRWRWLVVVATTGVVLGPTHLVGENLSNALNIALEIAALVALVGFVGGRRGMTAAVLLLVASGLAHWDFVALFALVMAVAFFMALPSSLRGRERGAPLDRTESGALVALGAVAGGILLVVVGALLRAPFRTMELGNDELLFRRKFRTDLARLIVPTVAGLAAPWALFRREPNPDGEVLQGRFGRRLLRAWTYVMAAGIVVGVLSFSVPPARFLAHLVAFPGAIAVAAILTALPTWGRRRLASKASNERSGKLLPAGIVVVALAALAVPGVLRWYRYPVLLEPAALQQARTADRYLAILPPHQPFVFLVDYEGRPGSLSAVLKERTIRIGVSPSRQLDAHIFVGDISDLLRGRRTPPPDERAERFTRRYWEDVRPLLPSDPPVVILRNMAPTDYRTALLMGARVVAPNVAVLRGPASPVAIPPASLPHEVPSLPAGILYGLTVLALLWFAGAGWTAALLGPGYAPETLATMAPVVGTAAVMLGGFASAEIGVRLGLGGALGVYLVVCLSGLAVAVLGKRLSIGDPPVPMGTDSASTPQST